MHSGRAVERIDAATRRAEEWRLVDWLRHMKMDLTPYKHIAAWSQRCCARPAYTKVMAGASA